MRQFVFILSLLASLAGIPFNQAWGIQPPAATPTPAPKAPAIDDDKPTLEACQSAFEECRDEKAPAVPVDRKALAKRWASAYDPSTGAISCSVTVDGVALSCWSQKCDDTAQADLSCRWDYTQGPLRWSHTLGRYTTKETFFLVEARKRLGEDKAKIQAWLATPGVTGTPVATEARAVLADLDRAEATQDADYDVGVLTKRIDDLVVEWNDKFAELKKEFREGHADHERRLVILENEKKTDVKLAGRVGALEEARKGDLQPLIGFEAGGYVAVQNRVYSDDEEPKLRRDPMDVGAKIGGEVGACGARGVCAVGQAGVLITPRDTGATGGGLYGNVGIELVLGKTKFRIEDGTTKVVLGGPFSLNVHGGFAWRGHGVLDGNVMAQSLEVAIGAQLRLNLPRAIAKMAAVPGLRFGADFLAGTVRHDADENHVTQKTSGFGGLFSVTFEVGTGIRKELPTDPDDDPAP